MSKKDENENKNNSTASSSKPTAYAGPDQVVYEGSELKLDGSNSFIQNNDGNNKTLSSYSWKQISGPEVNLDNKNISTPSFKAPYIDLDFNTLGQKKPYTNLTFELIVTDNQGVSSTPDTMKITVKMIQRALVLQGGGSLGAYEAGVFEELCKELIEKDKSKAGNARKNRPLFDIVAGTSIGAVNAVIIVDTVLRVKRENPSLDTEAIWKNTVKQLDEFWQTISTLSLDNPLFCTWWDFWHVNSKTWIENYRLLSEQNEQLAKFKEDNPYPFYFFWPENYSPVASGEAARRYFSWMYSLLYGTPNVMTANFMQPDTKFFSTIPFFRFDNTPLAKTIKKFWDYANHPIKTSFEKGEPRLLLVGVDVMDVTTAAAFDSYLCETVYENGKPEDGKSKHIIKYPLGINIEHVTASMSPHLKYKYPKFVEEWGREVKTEEEERNKNKEHRYRYFWDGAYLSNTPLRELLHAHRYYWHDKEGLTVEVPHLEVYIVNLYPTVEDRDKPPQDADTIQDRELDIRFHDRTNYDVKVAKMVSDYLILFGQVKNLALQHLSKFGKDEIDAFQKELEDILNRETLSDKRSKEEKRNYRDLIEGRFDIAKLIYIDRKDDGNTIFGKAAEFSSKTINELKEDGHKAAQEALKHYP